MKRKKQAGKPKASTRSRKAAKPARKTPGASRRKKVLATRTIAAAAKDGPFQNPELMVIGNSLAQGVRSLSFRPEFAAQCVGTRLAASQGWDFRAQTHPRHVLVDVEGEVRELNVLGALFRKKLLSKICDRVNQNLEQ